MSKWLREFYQRQPVLFVFGMINAVLFLGCLSLQGMDLRQLDGINIWVKPAKFYASIAVFALTNAYMFGYVRPERRQSGWMAFVVWATVVCASFETLYITYQAARGEVSHFNFSSLFTIIMYGLMGVGAVTLISVNLPLAYEIAKRPAQGLRSDYHASVVLGLVLSVILGGGLAAYMSTQTGHTVGTNSGHAPIFGWNRSGGDLRIAHFIGLHLHQALPFVMICVQSLWAPLRWLILGISTLVGIWLSLFVFLQALAGEVFLPF